MTQQQKEALEAAFTVSEEAKQVLSAVLNKYLSPRLAADIGSEFVWELQKAKVEKFTEALQEP